jgi:hypothetical protein
VHRRSRDRRPMVRRERQTSREAARDMAALPSRRPASTTRTVPPSPARREAAAAGFVRSG